MAPTSPHGSVWKKVEEKGWVHPITKVKAHRTKEQATATGDLQHYNGNWWADKLCNDRAKELIPHEAERHTEAQTWHTKALLLAIRAAEA